MIEDTLAKMQREIDRLSAQIEELRAQEYNRYSTLLLKEGSTAPAAESGWLQAYIDSADDTLKLKASDGSIPVTLSPGADLVSRASIAGRNALGVRKTTTVPNNVTTLIATVQATGGSYFTGSLRVSITTGSTNCLAGWTGIITYAWSSTNVVQDSATTFGGFSTFTVTASTNTGTRQVLINLLQVNGFAQTQNVYVAIQPLHAGLNTISVS